MKDIGFLQVKVLKAVDLLAADFSGTKCLCPFCFRSFFFSCEGVACVKTALFIAKYSEPSKAKGNTSLLKV